MPWRECRHSTDAAVALHYRLNANLLRRWVLSDYRIGCLGPIAKVHYFDEDGNETLYIGGSFAWRTNNPGNLTKPRAYLMKSAIGYAQRTSNAKSLFIIFPDRAAGQDAYQKLLKEVYGDSTIRGMITVYAPPSENDSGSQHRQCDA